MAHGKRTLAWIHRRAIRFTVSYECQGAKNVYWLSRGLSKSGTEAAQLEPIHQSKHAEEAFVSRAREAIARSILSPVSGFLKEAGFTHSLSPARNCTYGCTYCYVPTMGIYGGLKREDWEHWGQFTTFKTNAPELIELKNRRESVVYCSPLVDPYQPAESTRALMPEILQALIHRPPKIFVLQTRGPLVLRDVALLERLAAVTKLRISFSITTDREDVRRRYEPLCEPIGERLLALRTLRQRAFDVYATLAPLLPCDPVRLVTSVAEATRSDFIGDPLHVRQTKARGATTREAAIQIAKRWDEARWFEPGFQTEIVQQIEEEATRLGRQFRIGPNGFKMLTRD